MKYEYSTLTISATDPKLQEQLNHKGNDGWKLACSFPIFTDLASAVKIVFIFTKQKLRK